MTASGNEPIDMPDVVALKVAKPQCDQLRFQNEFELLKRMNHPRILKVYNSGVSEGRLWYSAEYVEAPIACADLMETADLSEKLQLTLMACEALSALHQVSIVHRDIKPSNFLIQRLNSGELDLKLCDLGVSMDEDRSIALTQSGAILGTPHYMAPEQLISAKSATYQCDIYSLGATLYEWLTGKRPYHNKTTVFEVISAITSGERPQCIAHLVPELPQAMIGILNCAMQKDPTGRYSKIVDFENDLRIYLKTENPSVIDKKHMDAKTLEFSWAHHKESSYVYRNMLNQSLERVEVKKTKSSHPFGIARKMLIWFGVICIALLLVVGFYGNARDHEKSDVASDKVDHGVDVHRPLVFRSWDISLDGSNSIPREFHEGSWADLDENANLNYGIRHDHGIEFYIKDYPPMDVDYRWSIQLPWGSHCETEALGGFVWSGYPHYQLNFSRPISRREGLELRAKFRFPDVAQETIAKAQHAIYPWLEHLDNMEIRENYELCASVFREQVSQEQWMNSIEKTLGNSSIVVQRQIQSATFYEQLPNAPKGAYVVFKILRIEANQQSFIETITPMLEGGEWKVSGYYIHIKE
jgi:hypothetical protein